jgi:hypothetical protein
MRTGLEITVLFGSITLLGVSILARLRVSSLVALLLVSIAGAGLGIGALLPQHGVRTVEWILAPGVLAALLPVHVRLLFLGKGPLRV